MFKKIIVSLITILILPTFVFADMGAPTFTEYSVRVKNPNGTTVDGKLVPYDTVIDGIMYEEEIDGILYGHSGQGAIKLSDCEVINDKIDFSKFRKENGELYVYKEGAYLYKGPSKIYGNVDNDVMIPVGEKVTYSYKDDLFAYVNYKGINGWVYTYQIGEQPGFGPYKEGSSLADVSSGKVHLNNETIIYTLPYKSEKTNTVIPKDTIVEYKYTYNYHAFNPSYYVTYEGTSGWVFDDEDSNNLSLLVKNVTIYTNDILVNVCKNIEYECKNIIGTIPKNTIVPVKYMTNGNDRFLYVEYKDFAGWILFELHSEETFSISYDSINIELSKEVPSFDRVNGEKIGSASGKVRVYDYYVYDGDNYDVVWLYLVDEKSWIKVDKNDYKLIEHEEDIKDDSKNDLEIDNKDGNKEDKKPISMPELVTYAVIGSIILSLVIIVIIKLVNKKKDASVESNKE